MKQNKCRTLIYDDCTVKQIAFSENCSSILVISQLLLSFVAERKKKGEKMIRSEYF